MASVRILFGGDFAPCNAYEALIASKGGDILGDAREWVSRADFTVFNLETPLCCNAREIRKSGPAIRSSPETLRALTEAGVDAVCLANNHIFDYGLDGLSQTFRALQDRDIQYFGAGFDRNTAEEPLRIVVNYRRISIFSFAEREFNVSEDEKAGAALLDPLRVAPLLMAERSRADAIIVCIHGGNEYFAYPRPGLRDICHFLVKIGADAIIGHHPHVPGAYEIYNEKPIFYSLGNLIFDKKNPHKKWSEGYLVDLEILFNEKCIDNINFRIIPYNQSVSQGGVSILEGKNRELFLKELAVMREKLENYPNEWLRVWRKFARERQGQILVSLLSPIRFRGLRRFLAFSPIRHLILPPSRRLERLNLLRCESHRELVIAALESTDN